MTVDPGAALRHFPLVPRPRPPCLPLVERIERQLTGPARAAAGEPDTGRALTLAASVMNQAALLVSDCGMPDLARCLCWQQFDAFRAGWPLDAASARHCLEPLVNLARLHGRAGEGHNALRTLESLYGAVSAGGDAVVDGRRLAFDGLVAADEDRRAVRQWLWTVVLADGVRALASQGRWQEAAAHADRHRGVGRRLLDGRQAAILARCATGDLASASAMLAASEPTEAWERVVGACLAVLCSDGPEARRRAVDAMTAGYLGMPPEPQARLFRVNLGTTVLGLSDDGATQASAVGRRVAEEAVSSGDGHIARRTLGDAQAARHLTSGERATLEAVRAAAGLGPDALAGHPIAYVQRALASSAALVRRRAGLASSEPCSLPTRPLCPPRRAGTPSSG